MNIGKENEIVEFKESTAEFDKACKAIVGMLNKSGRGTVYFGVKDNGDVIGQSVGKDTLSNLTDKIKDSIRPAIYPVIKQIDCDGLQIISVTFSGTNKPYAYKGAFYIRVEQQNLVVDPLVLRELIKEGHEYNDQWENSLTDKGIEYIDYDAVDKFYRQGVAMGRINKFDHTAEELLTQLNLMVNGKFTNAGYYLFGKDAPIAYKAVVYPTTERLNPIELKRFQGNIFNLILNIINFINEKMIWRIKIEGMKREEIPEIPVVAIREIVINSLVHCDFFGDTEHQVTIDPKNIEIYNPGSFGDLTPKDYIEHFIPSRTKHKVIQGIIFKAFDVETLGRGLKRMDKACREENIEWVYEKFSFGFLIGFKRVNQSFSLDKLSDLAKTLLNYIEKNDGILESIDKAAIILNRKDRAASQIVDELVKNDILYRKGSRKTGYWELINKNR